MCGRYTLKLSLENLEAVFHPERSALGDRDVSAVSKDQVFPTDWVPVLVNEQGLRALKLMRWGLIPAWSQEPPSAPLINARAETLREKPSFRDAFARQRCLVPSEAFLEWKADGRRKVPYRISMKDGRPFAMGAVWDRWKDPTSGEIIESVAIVTTGPNDLVAPIHDRMPLILHETDYAKWLDPQTPISEASALLVPFDSGPMQAEPLASPRPESPQLSFLD